MKGLALVCYFHSYCRPQSLRTSMFLCRIAAWYALALSLNASISSADKVSALSRNHLSISSKERVLNWSLMMKASIFYRLILPRLAVFTTSFFTGRASWAICSIWRYRLRRSSSESLGSFSRTAVRSVAMAAGISSICWLVVIIYFRTAGSGTRSMVLLRSFGFYSARLTNFSFRGSVIGSNTVSHKSSDIFSITRLIT